jgi:hypothetical protein
MGGQKRLVFCAPWSSPCGQQNQGARPTSCAATEFKKLSRRTSTFLTATVAKTAADGSLLGSSATKAQALRHTVRVSSYNRLALLPAPEL